MKIAIVRTTNGPLDINKYNIQEIGLARVLVKKGYSVHIYSLFKGLDKELVLERYGKYEIVLIPIKGILFRQVTFFPGLVSKLKKVEYDFVQVQESTQLMSPYIASSVKKMGGKAVLYQGMYKSYTGFGAIFEKILDFIFLNKMIRAFDLVFAKTREAKIFLEKKGYGKVDLLPVGLDFPDKDDNEIMNRGSIYEFKEAHEHTFIYIGKLEERRNPYFLLNVLNELIKEKKLSVGLIIIGSGPKKGDTEKQIQKLGLESNIVMINSVPNTEIHGYLQNCDLFLLPSDYEIFGMVVLESLYNGTPVISSETAGPSDIIRKNYLGMCLRLDQSLWVKEITKFINTDFYRTSSYNDMRKIFIETEYNWEKCSETFRARLSELEINHF